MTTYYGTFGHNQFHPITGQHLLFSYVELDASSKEEAEAIMWERFAGKWNEVVADKPVPHPAEPWVVEAWAKAGLQCMSSPTGGPFTRVALPKGPPEPAGETVTLRVVLSKQMASENALFIAGRCIAHRAGPNCTTDHGAGVWMESNAWPHAWRAARTFSIQGEGEALLVRYVPRALAEGAAAANPGNVSIVRGTESIAYLGVCPDRSMGPREISGVFAFDELWALRRFGPGYEVLADAASSRVEDDGALVRVEHVPRLPGQTAVEARDKFFSLALAAETPSPRQANDLPQHSGFFTIEMLDALCRVADTWNTLRAPAAAAIAHVEQLQCWRDTVVGVDVRDGRVVGVRMTSR